MWICVFVLRLINFREKVLNRLRLLHICVRPLVARSTNWAMREPQNIGRAIVQTLTLFLFPPKANEVSPAAKLLI